MFTFGRLLVRLDLSLGVFLRGVLILLLLLFCVLVGDFKFGLAAFGICCFGCFGVWRVLGFISLLCFGLAGLWFCFTFVVVIWFVCLFSCLWVFAGCYCVVTLIGLILTLLFCFLICLLGFGFGLPFSPRFVV